MTCGACVAAITKELENAAGVFRAHISLALGRASVSYDPTLTSPKRFEDVIRSAGYEATLGDRSVDETIEKLRQSSELQELRHALSAFLTWRWVSRVIV